ncbi:MAG: aminotransferase [Citricoccus sp.]|nr:aminotransferase [Citricoccus sp. WCRC_4]
MAELSREVALDLARRALGVFGMEDQARVEFVKHRENVVFRVDDSSGPFALRIHRCGHRTDAEVFTESAFMVSLRAAGVPVSEVVRTLQGELFARVRDEEGRGYYVDAQRWVTDSTPLGDVGRAWTGQENPAAEHFEQLGELCGKFHQTSQKLGRIPGYSRQAWDVDGLTGDQPLWGDPRRLAETDDDRAAIEAALERIRDQLTELGTGPDVYGVIHADFSPENVLVSPEGLTIIDFDDFGEGWWLFDLATVLFWYHRHPRAEEYRTALLGGYQRHVQIPRQAMDALDALVLTRGLTYLGWAADRPEDETSVFLRTDLLPVLVQMCRQFTETPAVEEEDAMTEMSEHDLRLLERRAHTLGPYSPLFYNRPRHFVAGDGVWLTDADGRRYLDGYNNVPQVGHSNPRVAEAVCAQLSTYNVHTRYLSEHVVDYAEQLLATFDTALDRVYFTNSGSEANDLALRIARHRTGRTGVIVTDHSYHGNTITLAALTTGLEVSEPFGAHVRAIPVPDLDAPSGQNPNELLATALAHVDEAIAFLHESGHGVAALLIDPAFSTEGLPRLPEGYLQGLTERIRAAGGLVISDEVQAGLGRLGDHWWGHQATGITPDLVTLGKPLGNGYPLGGVVTAQPLMEGFSSTNMYFNTFAGTPVAAAAGRAVLAEVRDRDLINRSGDLGRHVVRQLAELVERHPRVAAAKGRGLFFGLALVNDQGQPDPHLAKAIVEALLRQGILISRSGLRNTC